MKLPDIRKVFDTGVPALIWRWMAVSARNPAAYKSRLLSGLICGGIAIIFLHIFGKSSGSAMAGRQVFTTMLYILSLMMGFGGATATADLLSKEKREGTIGLLFLTAIKPWQLVVGKFALVAFGLGLGIVGQIPMILVPMLSGGVTLAEGLKAGGELFGIACFGSALGMAVSAFNTDAKKANGQASGILSLFWWILPTACGVLATKFAPRLAGPVALLFPVRLGFGPGGPTAPMQSDYWASIAVTMLQIVGLLALAVFGVTNTWQQGESRNWWQRLAERNSKRTLGPEGWRLTNRRCLLDLNPIAWLTAREWRANLNGLALPSSLLAMCLLFDLVFDPRPNLIITFVVLLTVFPGFILAGRFHATALSPWLEARSTGVLELLLTTPLTERGIMSGIWTALRKQFRWNIPVILLIEIAGAVYSYVLMTRINPGLAAWDSGLPGGILWLVSWRWVNLLLDLYTLGWTAPWHALSAKQTANPRTGSFPAVIFLPWAISFLIVAIWAWLDLPAPAINPLYGLPCLFLAVNVIKSILMILYARRNFFGKLREVAAKRYEVTA